MKIKTNFIYLLIGEDIELHTEYSKNEFAVFANHHQIGQVLMNLAANARDAIPEGGELTIRTETTMVDEKFGEERGIKPGNYMTLSVSDTGTGILSIDTPPSLSLPRRKRVRARDWGFRWFTA